MGTEDLIAILAEFKLPEGEITIEPLIGGRINQTFKVATSSLLDNTESLFVMQMVNSSVFKMPELIMKNLDRLISYSKLKGLDLIATNEGRYWYKANDGNFYRLMKFVPNYPVASHNLEVCFQAGRSVGEFHQQYWQFPWEDLYEVIAGFHDTPSRLKYFESILESTSPELLELARLEIQFALEHSSLASLITKKLKTGAVPFRVTHNDTKIDNVLFNSDGIAICLIDFDTVMPGAVAWDIGDAIRSLANSVTEEEVDVNKVSFLYDRFFCYLTGYASEMDGFLLPDEVMSLTDGCLVIAYEQGLRFLTDFLSHDQYYKTSYSNQNLLRTRIQFALLRHMLAQKEKMETAQKELFPKSLNG